MAIKADDFDKFFIEQCEDGATFGYLYLSTAKTLHYAVPKKDGFKLAVSFPVKTHRGEGNTGFPVVFTDFTTNNGLTLKEITLADMPKGIKQRFAAWLKLQ